MLVEEFKKYLADNGITEDSNEFDDLWASYLFGGRSPNEVYDKVHQLYNSGKIKVEPAPFDTSERDWFLNHPTA